MTIQTYIALLRGSAAGDGRRVVCPLQPDGRPKPVIDHHGVLYRLSGSEGDGVYAYTVFLDVSG